MDAGRDFYSQVRTLVEVGNSEDAIHLINTKISEAEGKITILRQLTYDLAHGLDLAHARILDHDRVLALTLALALALAHELARVLPHDRAYARVLAHDLTQALIYAHDLDSMRTSAKVIVDVLSGMDQGLH